MRSSYFVDHSCDYRPNWTPLSPINITYSAFTHGFPGGKRNKDQVFMIGTVSPGFCWGTILPGFLRLLRNDGRPESKQEIVVHLKETFTVNNCLQDRQRVERVGGVFQGEWRELI